MSTTFPGLPSVVEPVEIPEESVGDNTAEIFTLFYRRGADILNLHFRIKNPGVTPREHFRLAIERAKIHCDRMRYRFLFCRPYITDLNVEEERMAI